MATVRAQVPAQVTNGYSYVNVSKRTVGGPVEPGDTLEIRYSVHIRWKGTENSYASNIYQMRYYDDLPTNTTMITGSKALQVITNEGVAFREYSSNAGDDAGTYLASPLPGQYRIRINLGSSGVGNVTNNAQTTLTGGGSVNVNTQAAGNTPKWYSGHLFSTAFRVKVTGAVGSIIELGNARFFYALSSNAKYSENLNLGVSNFYIQISRPQPLCSNKSGTNFADEFSGTFGNGTSLGRSTALQFPIPGFNYISNPNYNSAVDDGMYAVTKNTSPRQASGNANATVKRDPNCSSISPPTTTANNCNNRMFSSWDIIGDHTGTNDAAGNLPPANGVNGGYMLLVNSNYVTGEAYRQSITGLCPNTTYEFSAWVRNVCTYCSWDANLTRQNGNGVLPNLTFVLDGIDRYSTGEIAYGGWVKKGFTFTTGATQNAVVFSIRNNAQGGGGNDWVMDDITVSTCSPNLTMKPYGNASVCFGNPVDFEADVRTFFNNYTSWRWERSLDGGATWSNHSSGTVPQSDLIDSSGTYKYTVPAVNFLGDSGAHGNIVRLRIATTLDNLNNNSCSFLDSKSVVIYVNNCQWVLSTDITSFRARNINSGVNLNWDAVNETEGIMYVIEKSTDQLNWKQVAEVSAIVAGGQNSYADLDAGQVYKTTYYRIKMVHLDKTKYTHQVTVQPFASVLGSLALKPLQNPFTSQLSFEIISPENGDAELELSDMLGKGVKKIALKVHKGNSNHVIANTTLLSAGTYVLTLKMKGEVIQKKVIKMNK
ncbi:T9SS type A sorting domain-containing protein [Flavihumibacter solisilvae]|uniref:Secretion system C-terminal sorting domain-containing protein n=1 Tax=Flavihumibacter solisilvae TaxID=1349421 RepID=A0A0C1L577_9BACT|nr:T9SS type A sorting domain-containing protein [Flavihumibacter solisilvae]KIC95262.1 hypothetical protein OI18_06475 [Flavihumibacter solisilvae]